MDNYITGHYGEDQLNEDDGCPNCGCSNHGDYCDKCTELLKQEPTDEVPKFKVCGCCGEYTDEADEYGMCPECGEEELKKHFRAENQMNG